MTNSNAKKSVAKGLSLLLTLAIFLPTVRFFVYAVPESDEGLSPYIIEFSNGSTADEFALSVDSAEQIGADETLIAADLTENRAAELSQSSEVELIEEDIIVKANTGETADAPSELTAWSSTAVGAEYARAAGATGSGVSVAVLDSGLDVYSEVCACGGVDLVGDGCNGDDMTGHGTAVSGIIASPADDEGVIGIAPDAEIYDVRVLDNKNEAPVSRIISGIDWCIANEIDIINMSFGTDGYSQLFEAKIEEAAQAGILMVSSAGNGETVQYPAKFDEVVAVGSVDSGMTKAEASATGSEIEFTAPGENVYSTSLIGGYGVFSGTSIAVPHITGAAAALLGKDTTKPSAFIRALLAASAKNLGDATLYGNGLPDLEYALQIYDDFAANYDDSAYQPPQNSGDVVTYEDEDVYVTGQWSSDGHNGLADDYFDGTSYNIRFPKLIKKVSLSMDTDKSGNKPFHGSGNYIVTVKLLFEIAREYKIGAIADHTGFRSDLASLLGGNYAEIISDISDMLVIHDNEDTYVFDDTDWIEGEDNFVSKSQKTATIVYGMFFHVLGDIYAHRTVVPPSSVTVTNRTLHGSGTGGNEGLYFVMNDFKYDCKKHIASVSDEVSDEYKATRDERWAAVIEATGFDKIVPFFKWLSWLFKGESELKEKYSNLKKDRQNKLDTDLLQLAMNVPSNAVHGKICAGEGACRGALKRIAGLGVLQFKDIKYFLDGYNSDKDLQTQDYKDNQAYYEDKAPGNEFYHRRYLAAKAATRKYCSDYYGSVQGGTINDFLPYYLLPLSEESGTNIKPFCLKLDQYYNYLKAFDSSSSVLERSTWSGTGYSLFDFTTIYYNFTYFVDPSTYPSGDKPPYYTSVFPSGTGKTSDDFYVD